MVAVEFCYTQNMINEKSVEAVNGSGFGERFRKPLYDSYCFANIPGTVERLLVGEDGTVSAHGELPSDVLPEEGKTYDNVVLFFVDAFGWRFFDRYKDQYPALQRFVNDGMVSKITSQFPSTTSAHVTTIHTGLPVGEHGVYELFLYDPGLDMMIVPLLCARPTDTEPGTLPDAGVDPKQIYPNTNIFQNLGAAGVSTHLFQSANFTPSPYNDVVTAEVQHVHPFGEFTEAFVEMRNVLTESKEKNYCYFYYGDIDHAGHAHTPDSPEFDEAVRVFFSEMEEFVKSIEGKCGNTLLLMTADHGQTHMDPETTILLDEVLPEIKEWTKTNRKGELLVPAGSARDFFLHIKDEHIEEAVAAIREVTKGRAEVHLVADLIEQGFFGSTTSDTFLGRVGNVVVLPYEGESVYWWGDGVFDKKFYGHHGGLTPSEMESIFLALEL